MDDPLRPGRYLAAIALLTALIWLLPLVLMRLPGFLGWSRSTYGSVLEYSFAAKRVDADVVIFGDSSALFGLDPRQISTALGLKAVNLPNTISNLVVMGDSGLRTYLHNNAPPRLIVFYFAPWNLDYAADLRAKLYEGEEMLARHGSAAQVLAFARHDWEEALLFPFKFYSANPLLGTLAGVAHRHRPVPIVESLGHVSLDLPAYKLIRQPCAIPARLLAESRSDSARRLAASYGGEAQTVFFMAPVPACDNAAEVERLPYRSVAAAAPRLLAPAYYENDGYYVHLGSEAVPLATDRLIAAIRPLLEQPAVDSLRTSRTR